MMTLVEKCEGLSQKKQANGFYTFVAGTEKRPIWTSCFIRISTIPDKQRYIDIKNNGLDEITYTKLPLSLMDKVYFVYVNVGMDESFQLRLPTGARIVGFHDPLMTGGKEGKPLYRNFTILVYCPTGEEPQPEPVHDEYLIQNTNLIRILYPEWYETEKKRYFGFYDLFKAGAITHTRLYTNNDGYVVSRNNRIENDPQPCN